MLDCKAAWNWVWIGLDGSVSFCCFQRELGPDLVLGNLNVDSLEDILNGHLATAIREQIRNEALPDVCRGCPVYEAERRRLESGKGGKSVE